MGLWDFQDGTACHHRMKMPAVWDSPLLFYGLGIDFLRSRIIFLIRGIYRFLRGSALNVYEEMFTVRYSDADRNGRLKLRAFFDFAQEVAGRHAGELGVGFEFMAAQQRAWMLSRVRFRINAYPRFGEQLKLITYPFGFSRLFARREFCFLAANGSVVASGSSYWLMVDTVQMRILNAPAEIGALMPDNSGLGECYAQLDKLNFTPLGKPEVYRIHEDLLDLNQHLNNAEYAAFVQNYLGADRYLQEIQINYHLSVAPGVLLEVSGMEDAGRVQVSGVCSGKAAFYAEGVLAS